MAKKKAPPFDREKALEALRDIPLPIWVNNRPRDRGITVMTRLAFRNLIQRLPKLQDNDVCAGLLFALPPAERRAFMVDLVRIFEQQHLGFMENVLSYPGVDSFPEFFRPLIRQIKIRETLQRLFCNAFEHAAAGLDRHPLPESPFVKRLDELTRLFRLDSFEREVLALVNLTELVHTLSCVRQEMGNCRFPGNSGVLNWLQLISTSPAARIRAALNPESRLNKFGFINTDGSFRSEILEFLGGYTRRTLASNYFKVVTPAARHTQAGTWVSEGLSLETVLPGDRDRKILQTLWKNRKTGQPLNILFAGPPGTGKTESAKALARALGLMLLEVRSQAAEISPRESDDLFRFRALQAAQYAVDQTAPPLVLIDEADDMINTRSVGIFGFVSGKNHHHRKAMINSALDQATTLQVWIANEVDGLDPSTRRRFDYVVRFRSATQCQRESIWQVARAKHRLEAVLSDDDIRVFAEKFDNDAGEIEYAMRNVSRMPKRGTGRQRVLEVLEAVLQAQRVFTPRENIPVVAGNVQASLAVDPLALSVEPRADLELILKIADRRTQAGGTDAAGGSAIKILLHGPPGTGKTHFAQSLARRLGRPLRKMTASMLLNKYVGESEKQIRQAFENAQAENAVLFFDEVDSLLNARERAHTQWEISFVNELLSALEGFNGVFLAATNHADSLDRAARRRFQFRLTFKPLDGNGVCSFYQRLLAPLVDAPLSPTERATLDSLTDLTPSDFAAVRDRYGLAGDHGPADLEHAAIFAALIRERNDRIGLPHPPIGFQK